MSVEQVRAEREAREARARDRAAGLPPGDYYAYDHDVIDHATGELAVACESHWDACLVLLAAPKVRA